MKQIEDNTDNKNIIKENEKLLKYYLDNEKEEQKIVKQVMGKYKDK